MKRFSSWIQRLLLVLAVLAVILFGMGSSGVPTGTETRQRVRAYTRSLEFDFVGWTLNALWVKFLDLSLGSAAFMTPEDQRQVVSEYLALTAEIQQLNWQIQVIYGDPEIDDPHAASAELRSTLEDRRQRYHQIAAIAESVLQGQINTLVNDLDLDMGGQAIPPVLYHSTPLPMALIVSPRDAIRQDADVNLLPDLSVEQQIALEEQVDRDLDVSSLVVNIGGVGVYPTMVMQTSDLNWLSEVVAHEWVHNYLTIRPLGMNYMKNPEMRVINETVASIAGKEIGLKVIEKFYPELIPPPPPEPEPSETSETPPPAPEPPAFDFRQEMHTTRVTVDALLEQGKVEEAEAYMEERRQVFWQNGYRGLRKLNQAYFAFHGAYADSPVSAAGEDPVGAAVRALRAQSPTLTDFLQRVSGVTDFAELQALLAEP
jgi:hypothetical protein